MSARSTALAIALLAHASCHRGSAREQGASQRAHAGGDTAAAPSATSATSATSDAAGAHDGATSSAAVGPARPAIADEPVGSGSDGGESAGAWQRAMHERLLAVRSLFDACGRARRGRVAAMAPALDGACACGVLCGVRFEPVPAGSSATGLRVPFIGVEGVRFDVRADGVVTRCGAAGSASEPEATHVTCNAGRAE